MNETLKYYYDGSNVIAEYDESDDLSHRYIHGTTHTDERAVMLLGYYVPFGQDDPVDTYYYLLQELGTVAGLMSKNGTLVEAYEYDAYGKASPWHPAHC